MFSIESDFSYAIFPLELIQNNKYLNLSSDEKLLYTLLLNRKNISNKNRKYFQDNTGVFVYYSNSQIQQHLNCSNKTAIKILHNLEQAGLIKKEYQKRGLPLKIYVNDIRPMRANTSVMSKQKTADKSPAQKESKPSFDIEQAEETSNMQRKNFAEKRKKRRTHSPTL